MTRRSLVFIALGLIGCQQPAPPPAPGGAAAPGGWEVRYNAVLALAHRGSSKFADPVTLEILAEMLDERQQLSNFKLKTRDGREVANPGAARLAVSAALRAVSDYKTRRPEADLAAIRPAIEKLANGSDLTLVKEARAALQAFGSGK